MQDRKKKDIFTFIARIFVNLCKKVEKCPKFGFFLNLNFLKKIIRNLTNTLLRGRATLL